MSLLSPEEQAFIQEHLQEDVSTLALKLSRHVELNARLVLSQISGYQAVSHKVPTWSRFEQVVYPPSLSLEQCSSEVTARYKASLTAREDMSVRRVCDLTGGFGVDFFFLAKGKESSLYVERQEALCELAKHNFQVLGLTSATIYRGDSTEVLNNLTASFDLIYLDPARRNAAGGKVVALSDCEPDVTLIKNQLLAKARYVLVKLSPMLDITMALKQLPETAEVHVVSVDGECKELLFLMQARPLAQEMHPSEKPEHVGVTRLICVNLRSNAPDQFFSFTRKQEQTVVCRFCEKVRTYLYEPNASLLKAGAYAVLTQAYNVCKLHPNSHLYTSEQLIEDFPGRIFQVEASFPLHSRALKTYLSDRDKANITVRNFPLSVVEIRKKTGLKEGGAIYLFATTLNDGSKVLLKTTRL